MADRNIALALYRAEIITLEQARRLEQELGRLSAEEWGVEAGHPASSILPDD